MNFDDALKQYLPQVWFRFKFFKYKHLGRGERELRLIRHLVEPGTTALDVGASIGIYAAEMARYAGRVIAFEANPQVAAFTRRVAARNVEVINTALSSAAGRTTLRMPRNAKGHAVTELASLARAAAPGQDHFTIEVDTRRLDDMPVSNCSFIKVDVEGHEEEVLEGATSLIAAQRPLMMIEADETFNPGGMARLNARHAALSYECFFFSQGRLRPSAEFDAARHQDPALFTTPGGEYICNFVFIPAEKKARVRASFA